MEKLFGAAVLTLISVLISACGAGQKEAAGFTLPEGDVKRGKAHYVAFGCNACHQHNEVAQLESALADEISIVLGGESARVRTYGELVTSVINPSHRVARRGSAAMADPEGRSKMTTYNDVMTVTQMVDLVAFLQASYKLSPHQNTIYPVYWYPEEDKGK